MIFYLKLYQMTLHGTVISRLFWPTLKDENFDVPELISRYVFIYNIYCLYIFINIFLNFMFIYSEMVKYDEGFQVFKPRRKLQWLKSLGKVQIELELHDRTLEFEVAPIYATIIYYFQQQGNYF